MDALFSCLFENCNVSVHTVNKLVRHMTLMHGSEINCQLRCPVGDCGQLYNTAQSYRKHVERKHQSVVYVNDAMEVPCDADYQIPGMTNDTEHTVDNVYEDGTDSLSRNIVNFINAFSQNVCIFSIRMREQYLLPRSTSLSIMNDVSSLFTSFSCSES